MKRHLLLIAFHFPPLQGSSGVHRMLSLAKYLPDSGWKVTVLTANPRAYQSVNEANLELIPKTTEVVRCQAFDANRHFSILGKYPGILALPDRWQSWAVFGALRGLSIAKNQTPDVIMSSFPIASANLIAQSIQKRTGIPWAADLRDPMVLDKHPPEGRVRDQYKRIEKNTFRRASRVIVTTPGAAEIYRQRYPKHLSQKVCVIENGFDEELFSQIGKRTPTELNGRKIRILHSGLIYPEARDPRPLLDALGDLVSEGVVSRDSFEVIFRASGQDSFISSEAEKRGLKSVILVKPSVNYREAIRDMLSSDSLLILQSADCNNQIPAKAYEYLRSNRPILALTDPMGDTGRLLSNYGVDDIVALENREDVTKVVRNHLQKLDTDAFDARPSKAVHHLSRQERVKEFVAVLDEILEQNKDQMT